MDPNVPSPEILKRYLANECCSLERNIVDAWYHKQHIESGEIFSEADEHLLYDRIQLQIAKTENTQEKQSSILSKLWPYASAAIFIISVGFLYFFFYLSGPAGTDKNVSGSAWITFTNSEKKTIRYTLPDKSIVWLQPYARISHPSSFIPDLNREIRFQGEGFFDVTRDAKHPFIIHCGNLITKVLGTSFNIKANKNDAAYKVSVVTGSVSVSTPDPDAHLKTVVLKPEQQVVFSKATQKMTVNILKNTKFNNENWQPVSLVFDETPMDAVAERLQQTFRIKIEFANPLIKKCRLKVDFNNQRLPVILEMIETLLGATYEMEGDRVILNGAGCGNE